MKTLHLYLTRQVLATLLMTVAVFTFVLLLANALNELLAIIVKRQGSIGTVVEAFALLIPFVLVFALPMGMLTAALLVFGRFSADQELTAVRSSGISLVALVSPILLLSVVLCGFSAWINMEISPRCRIAYKHLLFEMELKLGGAVVPEGRYVRLKDGNTEWLYYVERNEDGNLQGVYIYHSDTNQEWDMIATAASGRLMTTNNQLNIELYDAHVLQREDNGTYTPTEAPKFTLTPPQPENQAAEGVAISDMTIGQLQAQLRDLERSFSAAPKKRLSPDELRQQKEVLEKATADVTMPIRVQINQKIAISFACFAFTLVGIPLGIRAHRRETNVGIAMALMLVLLYYSFIILGQSLSRHADLAPHLIVWIPNFIFQAVGVVMLWRANRGI